MTVIPANKETGKKDLEFEASRSKSSGGTLPQKTKQNKTKLNWAQCLTPIILVTQEAKIRTEV
jgi:hypothetical protein